MIDAHFSKTHTPMNKILFSAVIFVSISTTHATSTNDSHEKVAGIVAQIQRPITKAIAPRCNAASMT